MSSRFTMAVAQLVALLRDQETWTDLFMFRAEEIKCPPPPIDLELSNWYAAMVSVYLLKAIF